VAEVRRPGGRAMGASGALSRKDVTIWRKPSEEFNGYLFKAQGVIDDSVNSVIDHIRPGPCRLDWDSLMTSMDILEHFEENCCVMRYTTAGQLWNIISPREFVDFSYTVGYEEGLLSCGNDLKTLYFLFICFKYLSFPGWMFLCEIYFQPHTYFIITKLCKCYITGIKITVSRRVLKSSWLSFYSQLHGILQVTANKQESRSCL